MLPQHLFQDLPLHALLFFQLSPDSRHELLQVLEEWVLWLRHGLLQLRQGFHFVLLQLRRRVLWLLQKMCAHPLRSLPQMRQMHHGLLRQVLCTMFQLLQEVLQLLQELPQEMQLLQFGMRTSLLQPSGLRVHLPAAAMWPWFDMPILPYQLWVEALLLDAKGGAELVA